MYGGARAEKQRIRQETLRISGSLTPEYRREASREITRRILALSSWARAKTVMAYWSLPEEPDKFIKLPHVAYSGRFYEKEIPVLVGERLDMWLAENVLQSPAVR